MIYVLDKNTFRYVGRYNNMTFAKECLKEFGISEDDCIFTEEIGMRYVSRVVEVDGKTVYMNKDWWTKEAPSILADYENHKVYDFIEVSKPEEERVCVPLDRFERELNRNVNMINEIDGIAGEVEYNIDVGNDMIALFREECIMTDFETITPMDLAIKLQPAYSLVMTGAFREAKKVFQTLEPDAFLTPERIQKYEAMLDSADAITYATDEDFFYTAKENT